MIEFNPIPHKAYPRGYTHFSNANIAFIASQKYLWFLDFS